MKHFLYALLAISMHATADEVQQCTQDAKVLRQLLERKNAGKQVEINALFEGILDKCPVHITSCEGITSPRCQKNLGKRLGQPTHR